MASMMAAIKAVASDLVGGSTDAAQFYNFARVAQARGATTIVDGGGSTYFEPAFLAAALAATGAAEFRPHRRAPQWITVPSMQDMTSRPQRARATTSSPSGIKILVDGPNQASLRLRPPGYLALARTACGTARPMSSGSSPALHNAGL
jgi:hypothetical protein